MLIGHIKEIVRHPVKSFRGENIEKTKIMDYGLYGDRSHALVDESTDKRNFLTITQFQEMVRYQARFAGEERMDELPDVEVTTPDGEILNWDDQALVQELEQKSNREISTVTYPPSHVPIGPIAVENILMVTDVSLHKLEELWGSDIDHRRFRPNLVISLEDKNPFEEENWFGKRLKIGKDVELEINKHCKRCMIITVNPDNAERDPALHKTVAKERKNNFGVYGTVIHTGDIKVNDEVHLLD